MLIRVWKLGSGRALVGDRTIPRPDCGGGERTIHVLNVIERSRGPRRSVRAARREHGLGPPEVQQLISTPPQACRARPCPRGGLTFLCAQAAAPLPGNWDGLFTFCELIPHQEAQHLSGLPIGLHTCLPWSLFPVPLPVSPARGTHCCSRASHGLSPTPLLEYSSGNKCVLQSYFCFLSLPLLETVFCADSAASWFPDPACFWSLLAALSLVCVPLKMHWQEVNTLLWLL